jgi:hypothetical protein
MNRHDLPAGDMHDATEIHDLLLLAVADVSRPVSASAGELITRARRQQRRRRVLGSTAVLGVAAVAVTTLVFAWPSTRPGGVEGPAAASPAPSASRAAGTGTTPTDRVRALLPGDAGVVTKVSTPMESVGGKNLAEPRSPLNGRYTLRRSLEVGYLEVSVLNPARDGMPDPSASALRESLACTAMPLGKADYGCTDERLADGSTLLTRVVPARGGTGLAYEACLIQADGRSVDLIASSGNPAYGPLMPAPPFTRAQLAAVAQEPNWFTG